MKTPTTPTVTEELIRQLEQEITVSAILRCPASIDPVHLSDLLAERADLKRQLIAAGVTAENCEMFRKDAERYQWLRDDALKCTFTAPAIMMVDEAGNPVHKGNPWNSLLMDEDADAAIDAARAARAASEAG